ncbi:MAG: STAS domain-containing protein [Actinobacteria bacterium]|nr:STAS domain-containing protein [Actinomycetota bacterium]MDQ3533075.1 STAS domain-containing protein [Actinomycetota bacterium]
MSDTFLVSVQHPDGAGAKLMCVGELDVATTDSLRRALEETIAAAPASLVIDCTGLSFISIDGLHLLLDTAERCRALGMAITVYLDSNGQRLLEVLEHPQPLVGAEPRS